MTYKERLDRMSLSQLERERDKTERESKHYPIIQALINDKQVMKALGMVKTDLIGAY